MEYKYYKLLDRNELVIENEEEAKVVLFYSKDNELKYKNYIHNIKENNIAKSVKLADLKHNSKLDRLDRTTERDIQRNKKYLEAIDYLES